MGKGKRVFVSYARPDARIAQALVDRLRRYDVETWVDYDQLGLGVDWTQAIAEGLQRADGLVVIASERSKGSEWVTRELRLALSRDTPIFPIVVDDFKFLPGELRHIQAALVSSDEFDASIDNAARGIAIWIDRKKPARLDPNFVNKLSDELAEEAQKAGEHVTEDAKRSVFVAHGHDDSALQEVTAYLRELGINPIVLRDMEEPEDSLLRRFLRVAEEAMFAVIICSPDDIGASLLHFEAPKGGNNALRYRARQNVILELGFFLGKLKDFNKVFVLKQNAKEQWPEFELPSDLAGAIFKELDGQGRWKSLLRNALVRGGLEIEQKQTEGRR
jgi:predicted nucleotide-binding protein